VSGSRRLLRTNTYASAQIVGLLGAAFLLVAVGGLVTTRQDL